MTSSAFEPTGTCATGGPMQHVPGSGEEMIRVLAADDTRIHTQLLADALRRDSLLEVISSPSHSRDLVEAARVQKVDVVVVSANLDEDPQRELEVVRRLAEGLSNREIAERLGLSQHTIKNYLFRVFDKLGVSSRLELLFMTLNHAAYFAPAAAEKSNGNGSIARAKGSSLERANGGSPEPHIQKPAADQVARLHVVPAATPEQRRSPEKVSGNQPHKNIASAGGADV